MKRIVQNITKIVLPLLLGIALFYALYSKLNLESIKQILQTQVKYGWVLLTVIISIFSHLFRALRWRLQLYSLHTSPTLRTVTNAIFGTYAMNLLFPRLGEVWRCGYVAKRQDIPFSQVLGSVVSDRLCDTVVVLTITLLAFLLQMGVFKEFLSQFPQIEQGVIALLTSPWLYLAGAIGVGALVWLFTQRTQSRWVVKVKGVVQQLWDGVATIAQMEQKGLFLLYTCAIWICYFLQLYFCFFAFPATQHLSLLVALVLFAVGSISMGIPVQGGLGTWHVAIIATLLLYGVEKTPAAAFALVAHGSQMAIQLLLGIYTFVSIALQREKTTH